MGPPPSVLPLPLPHPPSASTWHPTTSTSSRFGVTSQPPRPGAPTPSNYRYLPYCPCSACRTNVPPPSIPGCPCPDCRAAAGPPPPSYCPTLTFATPAFALASSPPAPHMILPTCPTPATTKSGLPLPIPLPHSPPPTSYPVPGAPTTTAAAAGKESPPSAPALPRPQPPASVPPLTSMPLPATPASIPPSPLAPGAGSPLLPPPPPRSRAPLSMPHCTCPYCAPYPYSHPCTYPYLPPPSYHYHGPPPPAPPIPARVDPGASALAACRMLPSTLAATPTYLPPPP